MDPIGAFPVTLFTDEGALDGAGLAEFVAFSIAAGAHCLVAPVNASEFSALSDAERLCVVEIVARVSGVSAEAAVEFSRHAADSGADALIAMLPYVRKLQTGEVRWY